MLEQATVTGEVRRKAEAARRAARRLAVLSSEVKDAALRSMADALEAAAGSILQANAKDLAGAKARGITGALIDRLTLTEQRVADMADGLREVAALADPIGEVVHQWRRPNGLEIGKVRVPLGVVGIIYEARPNVTVDAAGLCLKTGNAVVLRGSSEAIHSNTEIARVLVDAALAAGLPEGSINLIEQTDRAAAQEMMRLNGLIDVLIPRGGAGLIQSVVEHATIPVIETGTGNCHVYVDAAADLGMAHRIVINSKTHRPGVCNAAESLLVHRDVAETFLPSVSKALQEAGVVLRGCDTARTLVPGMEPASEDDWYEEYLDSIMAVRVVDDFDAALNHIDQYGSQHSEAIVTSDYLTARRFMREVDAAAVYVNASTRYTDGHQFGFGAEIGISTQKLHARGPMGLTELTTIKYLVFGEGHIRS